MVSGPLRVTSGFVIPPDELSWQFSRSSGPGGQGVNTTDSRVRLRWDIAASAVPDDHQRSRLLAALRGRLVDGELEVTAAEERSQLQNRRLARQRLALAVAAALKPPAPVRRATRPTRGSVERRIAAKRRRSDVKRLRKDRSDS